MEEYLKYIVVAIIILVLDGIWIYNNLSMYSESVKNVQKSRLVPNQFAAMIAYAFVLFASLYIAIPFTKQQLKKGDTIEQKLIKSLMYGGAVGFAAYGIYNFTSLALYKDYELSVALIDTTWGTLLNTVVVFIYTLL
jgi:uncharacterized membrane protein